MTPAVNTDPTILPAHVGSAEIQSAAPKPASVALLRKQILVSRLFPDQTDYIQHKTKAKNITVENLILPMPGTHCLLRFLLQASSFQPYVLQDSGQHLWW